jgi:hypothetical protein
MSHKNIDNDLKEKPFTSYIELQRKKEMKKIMLDNQRLLDRIQHTVPSYDHIEWERDAQKRMEYLRNMTEFPDYFQPPGLKRTPSASRSRAGTREFGSYQEEEGGEYSPQPPPLLTAENAPRSLGHRPILPQITQSPSQYR